MAQTLTIGSTAKITATGSGTAIDCDDDLHIIGTLDLRNDATLYLAGDLIKDGSFENSLAANTYNFVFNGTAPQNITMSSGTSTFSLYTMVIANPTTVTIDASRITQLTIVNVLDPQAGTFTTNDRVRLRARSTAPFYARVSNGSGAVSGNIEVEKRLSNTTATWRHMSLPINATWSTANLSGITVLFDTHTPANQRNAFYWNSNLNTGDYAFGLTPAPATTSTLVPLMLFNEGGSTVFPVVQTFSCKGPLQTSASHTFNLQDTRDPADIGPIDSDGRGWNFIANPWASLIDVNALLSSASDFTPAYKALHVYSSIDNLYRPILLNSSVTKIDYGNQGDTTTKANIPPFQGFWVKADAPGQVVNLVKATMQTTARKNLTNEQFMKNEIPTIRLNVFDRDSAWDQLVLYFDESLTRDFDLAGDAYYLASMNHSVPLFYALEGNSKASIVGRPADASDSVSVVFGSTKNQSKFYIHADLDELGQGWYVYLRDKRDHKTYQLDHNKSLAFSHFEGLNTNRFVVYYSKNENAFGHLASGTEARIIPFVRDNKIVMQSIGLSGQAQISVFDAVGRLLHTENAKIALGEEQILALNPTQKLLFITVTIGGQQFVEKVYY